LEPITSPNTSCNSSVHHRSAHAFLDLKQNINNENVGWVHFSNKIYMNDQMKKEKKEIAYLFLLGKLSYIQHCFANFSGKCYFLAFVFSS